MESIFLTTQDDASFPQLQKYITAYKHAKIVSATDVAQLAKKQGVHRSQKNKNLIKAMEAASAETEIYVIVDADTRYFSTKPAEKICQPYCFCDILKSVQYLQ